MRRPYPGSPQLKPGGYGSSARLTKPDGLVGDQARGQRGHGGQRRDRVDAHGHRDQRGGHHGDEHALPVERADVAHPVEEQLQRRDPLLVVDAPVGLVERLGDFKDRGHGAAQSRSTRRVLWSNGETRIGGAVPVAAGDAGGPGGGAHGRRRRRPLPGRRRALSVHRHPGGRGSDSGRGRQRDHPSRRRGVPGRDEPPVGPDRVPERGGHAAAAVHRRGPRRPAAAAGRGRPAVRPGPVGVHRPPRGAAGPSGRRHRGDRARARRPRPGGWSTSPAAAGCR